jgi:hypothetical protein
MEQGYYRLVEELSKEDDRDADKCVVGDLWYLMEIEGDEVSLVKGESTWVFSLEAFLDHFEYAPEGVEERQREMINLMSGLHDVGNRQDNLIESSKTPKLLGDDSRPAKPTSTELVAMASRANPAVAAKNLKKVKTVFAITKNQIAKRYSALQTLIKEQELILKSKTELLTKQIEIAQEAIYMINAYLGQDEEIIRLQTGVPADENEKIVIRQQVLFMDEESAVAGELARGGGIDFQNVDEFDKWVCDPEHLQQVLPERKGVVALRARRSNKFYDDNPFVNAELNRKNKCLYLLIRNGDNLFRIFTTLWVEEVLLPRKDEFESFFYTTKTNWDTHETVKEPLTPGSAQYMQAMDKAEAKKRRFYTVLILIQGLVDRTKVFHPLPQNEQINVCNLDNQKHITLRYDAENLLGNGRPDFNKWLQAVNNELEIGCRIIGEFDSYHTQFREIESRKGTKHSYAPDNRTIYIIDKKSSEDGFKFLYKSDHRWRSPDGPRVSFQIYTHDDFIVNIDSITIADIEFYIKSRTNRHHYIKMIPLLKAALAIKKTEFEEEAPFRQLLIGEIAKTHNVSIARAERNVDALIKWWKFKTRVHRALISDDAKALRMIVDEFGRRNLLDDESLIEVHKQVAEKLKEDQTLAIFYRPDRSYVVLRFKNHENIFVQEERWKLCADTQMGSVLATADCKFIVQLDCGAFVRRTSFKEWSVVDKRHESWQLVWGHPRWKEWVVGARQQEHLTDPEKQQASEYVLNALHECFINQNVDEHSPFIDWRSTRGRRSWLRPLAVISDKEKVILYYLQYHAAITKRLLTKRTENPEYASVVVQWDRNQDGLTFQILGYRGFLLNLTNPPWKEHAIAIFEDNIASAVTEESKVKKAKIEERRLSKPIHAIVRQANELIKNAWLEDQHKKFLNDYVDEDDLLWVDYKESLDFPGGTYPSWIEDIAGHVIERGININGWTLEKLLEEARKYGYSNDADKVKYYNDVKGMIIDYTPAENGEDDE